MRVIRAGHQSLIRDSNVYATMSGMGTADLGHFLQYLVGSHVPILILQNSLEWYERQKVGARLWPAPVLEHLRSAYDCRMLLRKRIDGRLLVVCELRNKTGNTGLHGGDAPAISGRRLDRAFRL